MILLKALLMCENASSNFAKLIKKHRIDTAKIENVSRNACFFCFFCGSILPIG